MVIGILWKFFIFKLSQQVFVVVLLTIPCYNFVGSFSFEYSSEITIVSITFLRKHMRFLAQVRWMLAKTERCHFWSLQELPETRENGNREEEGNKKGVWLSCSQSEYNKSGKIVTDKIKYCSYYYFVIFELGCILTMKWESLCFIFSFGWVFGFGFLTVLIMFLYFF